MARIFSDGMELGNMDDDFWNHMDGSTTKYNGIHGIPGEFLCTNQKEIKLKIKEGQILLETDITYLLGGNKLIAKKCLILILAECPYCHSMSIINQLCNYCGAPVI